MVFQLYFLLDSMEDSDHQSIQSAALIGSNDDLLTEILIRLPVISILHFKSVSKHWRSLLTHRYFTHRYHNNNLFKSAGLFGQNIYFPYDVENRSPHPFRNNNLDFYFNRPHVTIEQSCNGLLLCHAIHNGDLEYYVFNPTTKQLAFIPSLPEENIHSMALAFHQTECMHYKVVCIRDLDRKKNLCQIQVYSSDTRKWNICIETFSARISMFRDPVYWNGAIHWAPDFQASNFLYFKLDAEQLQMLPVLEELVSSELSTMYFGESRGHLHFISKTNCEDSISNLNVYEMLGDRSGWFVKYRVRFNELRGFPEMFDYNSGVVDVIRGKEEKETFLVLVTPGRVMRYNVHDKSFNELYSLTDDDFYDDTSRDDFYDDTSSCHRYIEALSSF